MLRQHLQDMYSMTVCKNACVETAPQKYVQHDRYGVIMLIEKTP